MMKQANEFNRISICISSKKIWDRLEITDEGTCQVKESQINLLFHKYDLFKMEQHESISNIFLRFTNIVNILNGLGKSYINNELVCKILRCLPKTWKTKVTVI